MASIHLGQYEFEQMGENQWQVMQSGKVKQYGSLKKCIMYVYDEQLRQSMSSLKQSLEHTNAKTLKMTVTTR